MVQSFQLNKITENIYQILNKIISACYITNKQFICPQILQYNEYLSKDGQRLQFLPFKHRCQPLVPTFQWCLRAEQKFSFTKLSLGLKCWVTNLTSDTNKIKKNITDKYFSGNNIPNCMKEVTWLKLCLSTNGHQWAALWRCLSSCHLCLYK